MATKKAIKKARAARPAESSPQEICFTIMPFGGWFDTYYEAIYVPAIESAGLKACRADDLYRPSTIVHDIWAYTQSAKLVLADLSGKNPNVFYELGLAHALAKPAILVTDNIEDVPFDLRALRVIEYNKNEPKWGELLEEKIASSIREVVAAPLQSVLPAFLTVKPDSKTKPVSEHEKQLLELKRELDLVRSEISRQRHRFDPRLPSSEARERISRYLSMGLNDASILGRLERHGVPSGFVLREIERQRARSQEQASLIPDSDSASS